MTSAFSENLIFGSTIEPSLAKTCLFFEPVAPRKREVVTEQKDENKEPENKAVVNHKELGFFEFRTKVVWFNAIGFLFLHLAAVYGLCLFLKEIVFGNFGTPLWSK